MYRLWQHGTMRRVWFVISWVLATAVVSFITFQMLDAADSEVRDRPLTPVIVDSTPVEIIAADPVGDPVPAADEPPATTVPLVAEDGDGSTPTDTLDQPGATTSTTAVTQSTTPTTPTTTIPGSSTTTTTVAGTTTTADAAWVTTTIPSPGGSLTVSYRPGEVRYEAAVPAAGYSLDIISTGPDVRVEFTADEGPEYEIRARWNDGEFESKVEEQN